MKTLLAHPSSLPAPRGVTWKYWLRLKAVPPMAKFLKAIGGRWERIGDLLGPEVLIAQAPQRGDMSSSVSAAGPPLRIAFLTMMGSRPRLIAVESVLAQALISRGHSVCIVLCDQQLPLCETKAAGSEDDWIRLCGKCYAFGKASFEAAGLEVVPVSALVGDSPRKPDEDWTTHVEAALLKHYRVGRPPETSEAEQRRLGLRRAAEVSAATAHALIERGVDRVVMSHGNYATWGPARDVFNANGTPVLVYSDTTKKDSIRLHWREDSFRQEIGQEYAVQRSTPLTPEQSARLDAYLLSRRRHTGDSHRYNFIEPSTPEQLRELLDLRPEGPVYVLFANLMWDAASSQRALLYADPIQWTLSTIDWFAQNPDLQLVVRPHPAEVVFGTNESVADVVALERPNLPGNVTVLRPDAPVNSWSLIQLATCGIVHTSTVGLELALEGKPCVVVSDTHYRGKGFTYDVKTVEEYFEVLRQLSDQKIPEQTREMARRYAYILFERYQLPFPQLYSPQRNVPVAYRDFDVHPEGQRTVDLICRSIEDLTDPLLPS